MDGETDWKLRLAVTKTHRLGREEDLLETQSSVYAEKPQQYIHGFVGKHNDGEERIWGL